MKRSHPIRIVVLSLMLLLLSDINIGWLGRTAIADDNFVPTDLMCEYVTNPMGVDTLTPRFSWILESSRRSESQSAYQIIVQKLAENASRIMDVVWDSGKVTSSDAVGIEYAGSELESGRTYVWKVRCWNGDGDVGPFSLTAFFHTGLLHSEDWKGQWIQASNVNNSIAPYLRKSFTLDKPIVSAYAYISGLGYYELYINGGKVGNHVLDPGTTEYNKLALYITYNVSDYIRMGANAIGVILGNGWFSPLEDITKYGDRPRLLIQLVVRFSDGTGTLIISDPSWKTVDSPILYNSIWNGEFYDARLEKEGWSSPGYDDSDWFPVELASPLGSELKAQIMPPIIVDKTLEPVKIANPTPGVYIYDFGQNFAGWTKLTVSGPRGTRITLRHAELLRDDGTLYTDNLRGARATDVYVLKGNGEEIYEPRFTYHGFRYVEMTGAPSEPGVENLEGMVVHSSVEPIGNFMCSNALLNSIQHNIVWGQLSNLMSIPTDCSQRDERMGWMGDAQLSAEEAIYNFWMPSFYEKWTDDIMASQHDDGSVSDTVPPHWQIYPSDPAWGTATVLIPWYVYQYCGDKRILEGSYASMQKWLDFLSSQTTNGIVTLSKYGDWCEPSHVASTITPGQLISTGYYYYDAHILAEIAGILGKPDDEVRYQSLARQIAEAYNRKFLNKDTGQYAQGSQTSNAFSLFLGIVPSSYQDAVLENLVGDIVTTHAGHLNTGICGTKFLVDTLTELGSGDVMYRIATQDTYPSWGYWISLGATTLWERWESIAETGPGMASYNHIMFGSIGSWFYGNLAGIRPASPGYAKYIIKPYALGDLKWVKASTKTIRGLISSSWVRTSDSFHLNVTIPVGTSGTVSIPKMKLEDIVIKEGGNVIWSGGSFVSGDEGITNGHDDGDHIAFEVGSGSYVFKLSGIAPSSTSDLKYVALEVSSKIVEQGSPVTFYVTVRNPGVDTLEKAVTVYVDGKEVASKFMVLRAKETKQVDLTYQFDVIGSHDVKVDNLAPVPVNVILPLIILAAYMVAMIAILLIVMATRRSGVKLSSGPEQVT